MALQYVWSLLPQFHTSLEDLKWRWSSVAGNRCIYTLSETPDPGEMTPWKGQQKARLRPWTKHCLTSACVVFTCLSWCHNEKPQTSKITSLHRDVVTLNWCSSGGWESNQSYRTSLFYKDMNNGSAVDDPHSYKISNAWGHVYIYSFSRPFNPKPPTVQLKNTQLILRSSSNKIQTQCSDGAHSIL